MPKKLTPKRLAFIKETIDNPTKSLAKRVVAAGYEVKDSHSASQIGGDLLKDPQVVSALRQHNDLFESIIVKTAQDWMDSETPRKREISLNAAMFGSDKVTGKATTRVEMHSEVFNVTIDLTGSDESPPPDEQMLDMTED